MAHLVCPNSPERRPHSFRFGGDGFCTNGCGFNAYSFPTGYERKADMPQQFVAEPTERNS